ncbi:hypothetical protein DPMN_101640 [Dreissena polymorpha]|uniref:Uncharacterized protein n=1 Tax=Dreissena polymorpha TaxID=45954 RepID=A0A9D4LJI1_DREPO|nr:hypothetical protein DPMN_101640 [Dreissena polymorpha]
MGICWNRILKAFANSLDPDETPQNVASHPNPNYPESRRVHWLLSLEAERVDLSSLPQTKEAPLSYKIEKTTSPTWNSLTLGRDKMIDKIKGSLIQDSAVQIPRVLGVNLENGLRAPVLVGSNRKLRIAHMADWIQEQFISKQSVNSKRRQDVNARPSVRSTTSSMLRNEVSNIDIIGSGPNKSVKVTSEPCVAIHDTEQGRDNFVPVQL